MIQIRKAGDRGHFDHGWLDTWHTFSFASYHDPAHMGFRSLRVINEDYVEPGQGFGTHPHRDMEIITYIVEGALEHRDSMGTGSIIRPGEVQRMSAGTGVTHSEFNPSREERVHLLQIWLLPERAGIAPSYEQKAFSDAERTGRMRLVASRDGEDGSVRIHQDARLYASILPAGGDVEQPIADGRYAWIQVIHGALDLNGTASLQAGDGAAVSGEKALRAVAREDAEFLVFDLA
jgi:redox-sensitive bicupin YhaK (pirin superfamily)